MRRAWIPLAAALWTTLLPAAAGEEPVPLDAPEKAEKAEEPKPEAAQDPSVVEAVKHSTSETAREPVRRGVDFLLRIQNANGSWGSGESARTYEILADVPGSHH